MCTRTCLAAATRRAQRPLGVTTEVPCLYARVLELAGFGCCSITRLQRSSTFRHNSTAHCKMLILAAIIHRNEKYVSAIPSIWHLSRSHSDPPTVSPAEGRVDACDGVFQQTPLTESAAQTRVTSKNDLLERRGTELSTISGLSTGEAAFLQDSLSNPKGASVAREKSDGVRDSNTLGPGDAWRF